MSFSNNNITEKYLIDLLQQKDQKVLALLYEKYGTALLGVIYNIVKDQQIAEDILQSSFLKIWKNAKDYNPQKGRLFTWMLNIARNNAIDQTRSKLYKQRSKNEPIDNNLVNKLEDNLPIDQIGLKDFVQYLDQDQQKIVELIYFQGFSHSETAKQLDLPLGTVKTRVRAALMILRKKMLP